MTTLNEGSLHTSTGPGTGTATPLSGVHTTVQDGQMGVENAFKKRKSFNSRKRDVEEISKRHPNKIPIIVERGKREKNLPLLDKSKFLVPEELNMMQLTSIIRRRLELTESQAFFIIINSRTMASASITLMDIYRTDKDADGFLYCTYCSQEVYG